MRQVLAEPVLVAPAVERAGDHPVVLLAEALDREVAAEPAGRREQRRVDRLADGHVDVVDDDVLQRVLGARSLDVELVEHGEVDHADAVAHRQVLGVDDRRPPAAVPLVRPVDLGLRVLLEECGIALVPLRAFPAPGVEEHRAECLLTGVERAAAHAPLAPPLLARVHDAVRLVVVLRAAGEDVVLGPLVRVEAADVAGVRVAHVRVPVGHPLGDELGDARPLLDPHRRCAPQVGDLHGLAEHRHRVRRERQEAVDRVADLGRLEDLAHQLQRALQLAVEVVGRERQLGRAERRLLVGRDVVGVVEDRPVGVRPDLHRPGRLALVAERVHVADDREGDLLVRLDQHLDRTDVGHLVHGRGQRDRRPGHLRDARAPHAAGDRDLVAFDAALVRHHRTHDRAAIATAVVRHQPARSRWRAPRCWRRPGARRWRPPPRASACPPAASRPPTRWACRSRRARRTRR